MINYKKKGFFPERFLPPKYRKLKNKKLKKNPPLLILVCFDDNSVTNLAVKALVRTNTGYCTFFC